MTAVLRLPLLSSGVCQTQMKETLWEPIYQRCDVARIDLVASNMSETMIFTLPHLTQLYGFPRQIGRFFKNRKKKCRSVRAREVKCILIIFQTFSSLFN